MVKVKNILKKLTWFDGIFLGLFLLTSIFLLMRFKRDKAEVYVDLTFKHQDWREYQIPLEYWQIINIKTGDAVYNSTGRRVAEVVDITRKYCESNRVWVQIILKIEGTYNNSTHCYVYNGKPLLIGSELDLSIGKTRFVGLVQNVYKDIESRWQNYRVAKAEIDLKYRNYEPWHAKALKDFKVKDSSGEVILKTKKLEIMAAEKVVETSNGNVYKRYDPIKKDVVITLELPKVHCIEGTCFYNYYPLKVGGDFYAASDYVFLNPIEIEGQDKGSIMDVRIEYLDKEQ